MLLKKRLWTSADVFVNDEADPYVEVRLGETKVDTSDEYVANSLNPIFGKWVSVVLLVLLIVCC